MIRKIKKNFNRLLASKASKYKNTLYVINISIRDMIEVIEVLNDINLDNEIKDLLDSILISCISMFTMSQISVSARPENFEYVDKLPSYKDLKRKFICSEHGRSLAACMGFAAAFPYAYQDKKIYDEFPFIARTVIYDFIKTSGPNYKRIKPTVESWPAYAKGEMGAAIGQMLSCPATNLNVLNINSFEVCNFGILDAVNNSGISPAILDKYRVSIEDIKTKMRNIYLFDDNGTLLSNLTYNEPKLIYSKIQEEILGDFLFRDDIVNTNVVKGLESDFRITKKVIEDCLSKRELLAYNFAIRSGDKNILKRYIDLVKKRIKKDTTSDVLIDNLN